MRLSSTKKSLPFRLFILATGLIFVGLTLSSCSFTPDEQQDTSKWSAKKLYDESKEAMEENDYEAAIELLETLEAKYPFGQYAEQAQLDMAYAFYKSKEANSAISAADRFIKLHPRHVNVDYAYYMRGLASESKKENALDSILPQDSSLRDPESTRKAYEYYSELVEKFPNSRYTKDAALRRGHLRNSLAAYEIHVANYYVSRGAYIAAINRAKYVVENHPQTPSSRQALQIMVECYTRLGMDDLAEDVRRVQQINSDPESAKPDKIADS